MNTKKAWDDVVVGAGSAGVVIASRLSEDPDRRVLLLEAGPDYPALEEMPHALLNPNTAVMDGCNWHINALIREESALRTLHMASSAFVHASTGDRVRMARTTLGRSASMTAFDYCVGKVVGGSSAINGALAMRGIPEDYDEWQQYSQGQWSWREALPYFCMLEDDQDFEGPNHGRGGPIPVWREHRENLARVQEAFMQACIAHGYPTTADHNDRSASGIGVVPKSVRDNRRMSAALTYLRPARQRQNLDVVANAHVHRLLWKTPSACAGVEAEIEGKVHRFDAERVIICGGALNTPTLLMRSGIGKPEDLRALGIEVRIPLAGVGRNLIDHAVVGIWAVPKPGASTLDEPSHQALLSYTSEGAAIAMTCKFTWWVESIPAWFRAWGQRSVHPSVLLYPLA